MRIRWIRMFLGLLDPELDLDLDPLVRGMDPDPELNPEPDPNPLVRYTDPGIQIRIRTNMSRIPNTCSVWYLYLPALMVCELKMYIIEI